VKEIIRLLWLSRNFGMVQQLIRNEQVAGSSPVRGSSLMNDLRALGKGMILLECHPDYFVKTINHYDFILKDNDTPEQNLLDNHCLDDCVNFPVFYGIWCPTQLQLRL